MILCLCSLNSWGFPGDLMVKNPPANAGDTKVWTLGWKNPLEEGMVTGSSILSWRIPWTEESGRLQSMGLQRVRHDWVTKQQLFFPIIINYTTASLGAQQSRICLQRRSCRRLGFNSWVRKIPWRRKWEPIPVFFPGKSHGQRSLAGYHPQGHKRAGHDLATKQQLRFLDLRISKGSSVFGILRLYLAHS